MNHCKPYKRASYLLSSSCFDLQWKTTHYSITILTHSHTPELWYKARFIKVKWGLRGSCDTAMRDASRCVYSCHVTCSASVWSCDTQLGHVTLSSASAWVMWPSALPVREQVYSEACRVCGTFVTPAGCNDIPASPDLTVLENAECVCGLLDKF